MGVDDLSTASANSIPSCHFFKKIVLGVFLPVVGVLKLGTTRAAATMYFVVNAVTIVAVAFVGAVTMACPLSDITPDGKLSFVNDVSSTQIARHGDDKVMDCAAANFCTVTWYKDGVMLPGQQPGSEPISGRAQLQDNGQYLALKGADVKDSGEYACVVTDGVQQLTRTTRLVVLGESYKGAPIFLGGDGKESCRDQTADLHGSLHFSCSFFVGKELLSRSSVGWLKVTKEGDMPMEFLPVDAEAEQDSRNDDVIIARLHIRRIGENDFGSWKVYVENGLPTEVEVRVHRRTAGDSSTSPGAVSTGLESLGSEESGCSAHESVRMVNLLTGLLVLTCCLLLTVLVVGLWWANSVRNRRILSTKADEPDIKTVPLP